MTRIPILLLAALAALNASAATRYVAKSGGCSHMTGKTCSTAAGCGATIDTACCEIQAGETARASGDTLEIHAGTYNQTGGGVAAGNWVGNAVMANAKITKSGVVKAASGETYTLDLGAGSRLMGLWIAAPNVDQSGATCVNAKGLNDLGGNRVGCVTVACGSDSTNCANVQVHGNKAGFSAAQDGGCLSCNVCYRFQGSGSSSFYDNECNGSFSTGVISMGAGASGSVTDLHHNKFNGTRTGGGSQTCGITEHNASGATVNIHHNDCKVTNNASASRFWYPRDNNGAVNITDNTADGPQNCIYTQDDDTCDNEAVTVKRNTFTHCEFGSLWQTKSYRMNMDDNSIQCGTAVQFRAGTCPSGGVGSSGDSSTFNNNKYLDVLKLNVGGQPEPQMLGNTQGTTLPPPPPTSVCGNGTKEGAEACDDGNTTTETACPYGTATCTKCNASCSASLSLTGPRYGDGIVNGPEGCDGSNMGGKSCSSFLSGCTTGTPTCAPPGVVSIGSCVACVPPPPPPPPPTEPVRHVYPICDATKSNAPCVEPTVVWTPQ